MALRALRQRLAAQGQGRRMKAVLSERAARTKANPLGCKTLESYAYHFYPTA